MAVQDGDYIKKYKPDAKVLYTTAERVEMLESLRIVDKVVVYESVDPEFFRDNWFLIFLRLVKITVVDVLTR